VSHRGCEKIPTDYAHPRLVALIDSAIPPVGARLQTIGIVHPGDGLALEAARLILEKGIARPVLVGEQETIKRAAEAADLDANLFEQVHTESTPKAAAVRATKLVRDGALDILMKGSLHTDELMAAIVNRDTGLRGSRRIAHTFLFDLPRYHKLLALADCVVNISPDVSAKADILRHAIDLLHCLGIQRPKVGILAAVENENPAIQATIDAKALTNQAWVNAIVEGPFGFDNAFSERAARAKGINSEVAGDADLMLVPDLNAGNMLYKSFIYAGGGDCAGVVLGARVPIVLTSRSDSTLARLASAALAVRLARNTAA
jgi:phosphate acetyltransferase